MMCYSDFIDVFSILDLTHQFIPGDLNDLIGDVIGKNCHEMLHLMPEKQR